MDCCCVGCCCAADAAIRVGSRSATAAGDFGAGCCLRCCFVVVAVVAPRCMKRMFLVAPDSVRDAGGCCCRGSPAAAPPGRGRLVPAVAAAPEGDGGGMDEPGFHIRMCETEGSKSKEAGATCKQRKQEHQETKTRKRCEKGGNKKRAMGNGWFLVLYSSSGVCAPKTDARCPRRAGDQNLEDLVHRARSRGLRAR